MGTWSLMLMVAKGQIKGAASLLRAPLVAEERSELVPRGRGGGSARGIAAQAGEVAARGDGARWVDASRWNSWRRAGKRKEGPGRD